MLKPDTAFRLSLQTGLAVTGGWDSTVRLWDPRQPHALVHTMQQPDKYGLFFLCAVR